MPPLDEEIVEKSASSPIASSCMVLAFLALLGAMAFQILEYGEYRSSLPPNLKDAENPAQDTARADIQTFRKRAADMIKTNTDGDESYFGFKEAVGAKAGGGGSGASLLNPPPEGSGESQPSTDASPSAPSPTPAEQPGTGGGETKGN